MISRRCVAAAGRPASVVLPSCSRCAPSHVARFSPDKQHSDAPALSKAAAVTADKLLESLRAHPAFAQQLGDPAFEFMVSSHLLLHDAVSRAVPLARAPTKVSDASGVFLRHTPPQQAPPGADSGSASAATGPLLRVQTLQPLSLDAHSSPITSPPPPPPAAETAAAGSRLGQAGEALPAAAQAVEWAHHTFALSPFYCYSKSALFSGDTTLLAHLELEMGVVPGQSSVLLYVSMDPKLSLTLHPAYLDHFYLTPPSPAHTHPHNPTTTTTTTSSSSSSSSSSSRRGSSSSDSSSLPSWAELEARAAGCPGFTRFTSPDLHVRAFASTAILFQVDREGWPEARQVLADAAAIWTAWASTGPWGDHSSLLLGGAQGSQHTLGDRLPPTPAAEDVAARSWAWRRFPRRERSAAAMAGVFGQQVMEDYWDSMAGEQRIRLP